MGCIFGVCVSFMIRIEWLRFTRYEVKEGIWRLDVGVIRFGDDDDSSGLMNDGFEGGYCNFSVVSGFVGEKEMGDRETLLLQETRISVFIKLAFLVFTYSGTTKLQQ